MSITDKRLTVIQTRVEEATEGPWFVEYEFEECPPFKPYANAIHGPTMQGVLESPVSDDFKARYGHQMDEVGGVADADAELIAHAREDIPALLAEVHRLRDELDKVREITDEKVERACRAFGAATATVSSIPPGMSETAFIDGVGIQNRYAIRAALETALGGGDDAR